MLTRLSTRATRATRGVTLACAAVTSAALVACSGSEEIADVIEVDKDPTDYFGYQVDEPLLTTNAATRDGASVNAQVLSARLYPAAFVAGPSGQMIPNTDLISARSVHGPSFSVEYRISDEATFSDGQPVTCLDYQLTYTAGTMPQLFNSHIPLMEQVEQFQCSPGSKNFRIVFADGEGGRWRELFGPGTVLPAHTVAAAAGVEESAFAEAMDNQDEAALEPVAEVWNTGFTLAEFDPQLQVTSGPFVIESVGEQGEVVLARNPHYAGDAANLDHLVVWPREADTRALVDSGALRVAETPTSDPEWVDTDDPTNPFQVESTVGVLTDSLHLSETGVLGSESIRQAFEKCIDRDAVARASSEEAGVEVPPVAVHTVPHNDPIRSQLTEIAEENFAPDYEAASALWGTTIRIGYVGPDARKAAMVEAIRSSCEQAGITVEDASGDSSSLGALGWDNADESLSMDAFLSSVDPMNEYGTVSARLTEVEELREAEEQMWAQLPLIPLSAEPRTFVVHEDVGNVVVYSGLTGIGWNKDRWRTTDAEQAGGEDAGTELTDTE